jgi:ApaG protein
VQQGNYSQCVTVVAVKQQSTAPKITEQGIPLSMSEERYKIGVTVETNYIPEQSLPEENQFVFSYTITIRNEGAVASRLLNRYWLITNGDGKREEVRGEGVVGEQPYLQPGEKFRYTSGTVMETPVGTMEGSYQMLADDGEKFDAPIPLFSFSTPHALH